MIPGPGGVEVQIRPLGRESKPGRTCAGRNDVVAPTGVDYLAVVENLPRKILSEQDIV